MRLINILKRNNWNEDKLRFFLNNKIHDSEGNLRKDLTFPNKYIQKIESSPQFSLFEDFNYQQMKAYQNGCDMLTSQNTLDTVSIIESFPHNFNLPEQDFTQEPCFIMVDASLKKYGKDEKAGIAGCIRNHHGNIVLGFAYYLENRIENEQTEKLQTGDLEFLAIQEGVNLAQLLKLKNYTIVSDCIGNVITLNKIRDKIPSLNSDYFNDKTKYDELLMYLENDNGKIVYVPREYNNIADEFSKSYQKRMGELFKLNNKEIEQESIAVLKKEKEYNSEEPVFFYHSKQFIHNKEHNPYEMSKNLHLEYVFKDNEHSNYEVYLCPIIHNSHNKSKKKHLFQFLIDPINQSFSLFSCEEIKKGEEPKNIYNNSILNSLCILKEQGIKSIALFANFGINAVLNKISHIPDKDIHYYQQIYECVSDFEHWGAFLASEPLNTKLNNYISNYLIDLNTEKIEQSVTQKIKI